MPDAIITETITALAKHYAAQWAEKGATLDQIDAYIAANWERICSEAATIALGAAKEIGSAAHA